jgi:hypothetical protein
MKKDTIVVIGELIGEALIGVSLGFVLGDAAQRANKVGKTLIIIGGSLAGFTIGRTFARELYGITNKRLGTHLSVD